MAELVLFRLFALFVGLCLDMAYDQRPKAVLQHCPMHLVSSMYIVALLEASEQGDHGAGRFCRGPGDSEKVTNWYRLTPKNNKNAIF